MAVKEAGERAVKHCRSGKGPYILEIKTYRYRGHSMSDPAKYRTREEVQKMRDERDPIEQVRDVLLTGKHASEDDLKAIDKEIKRVVNASAEFAKESPIARCIRALDRYICRGGGVNHGYRNLMPALRPHGRRHARQMAGQRRRHRFVW